MFGFSQMFQTARKACKFFQNHEGKASYFRENKFLKRIFGGEL